MRLVARGWNVSARIVNEGGLWFAVVDGVVHPSHADPYAAPWVSRVWEGGRFIDEAEFRWRNAVRDWARAHCPSHPAADATQPINNLLTPIIPRTL